jgi:hypothetical protein
MKGDWVRSWGNKNRNRCLLFTKKNDGQIDLLWISENCRTCGKKNNTVANGNSLKRNWGGESTNSFLYECPFK